MNNLSYRHIVSIAVPVMLANLAMPLQSTIDTAIVGHFSDTSKLAGMGLAIQLLAVILVSFNFLQYASSGLSAQALGAFKKNAINHPENSKQSFLNNQVTTKTFNNQVIGILQRALITAISIGFILILCQQWLMPFALKLLAANTQSTASATQYLQIRFWGIPAELMNYAFVGWFAGQSKTKYMLFLQSFIAITNIMLTLCFVFVFNMGLTGVALGTVLAYWLAICLAFWLASKHINIKTHTLLKPATNQFNLSKVVTLFALNKDIFIRTFLLTLSFTWVTRMSAMSGDVVIAANTILLQILMLSAFALDGVAVAAESLAGQSYAQKSRTLLKVTIKRTGIVSYLLAIFLTLLWIIALPYYLSLMTNIVEIATMAYEYRWYAVLLPVVGAGAYWLDGIFFGLTDGTSIRRAALINAALFFPLSWWLFNTFHLTGIWLSIWLILLLRMCILSLYLPKHVISNTL